MERQLTVFSSFNGAVSVSIGTSVEDLGPAEPVEWLSTPPGGVWMEAVVDAGDGTFYGHYHNEMPATECHTDAKVRPRIGAGRSVDRGRTWEDLGIILEDPEPSLCSTANKYNVGGVGDFSAILDRDRQYLYIVYSVYAASAEAQGIAVARMLWADRDEPAGALAVWQSGLWLPATLTLTGTDADETNRDATDPEPGSEEGAPRAVWTYPQGTPIYAATRSWHSASGRVDAFWGPSAHWNSYLDSYVMLVTRSTMTTFSVEGIYILLAPDLANPETWMQPVKILSGGSWYPQVMGSPSDDGSDTVAGQRARFFLAGSSSNVIEFTRQR